MKVTKGDTVMGNKKVIAFYTGEELIFRGRHTNKNFALNKENTIYEGSANFEEYLKSVKTGKGSIVFYEGDVINIQL